MARAFSAVPQTSSAGASLTAQALRNVVESAAPSRQTSIVQDLLGTSTYPRVPLSHAFPSAPELQEPVKYFSSFHYLLVLNNSKLHRTFCHNVPHHPHHLPNVYYATTLQKFTSICSHLYAKR